MSARAIIAPMSFGDTTLPRININYVRPIPGASHDWAVNQMPSGPMSQWPSLIDGTALQADGASPVVVNEGKLRCARFDGATSRMRAAVTMTGAHSVVAVYRFVSPKPLDTVHYGYASYATPQLGLDSTGAVTRATSGTSYLIPSPGVVPSQDWCISVLTVDGPSSALLINSSETAGNLPAADRDGITLGFSGGAVNRTAIEYKRVAIVPGSMTSAQRAAIADQMRAEYT